MKMYSRIWLLLLGVINFITLVHSQSRVWSCNFEEGDACGAILRAVGNNIKFDFRKGATPSDGTGPVFDHTFERPQGTYIYLEATDREEGNQAIMVTPTMTTGQPKCLEFYYHMFSESKDHQGRLRVEVLPSNDIIFELDGNQKDRWNLMRLDIKADVKQLVFRAIRGPRYQSDIALDDIFIASGGCKVGGLSPPRDQDSFPGSSNQGNPAQGLDPPTRNPVDPPIQADFPPIPDRGQRPDPPTPPPIIPRPSALPSLPLDPRSKPFQVRLVSGRTEYQGRLEVFVNGKWGTVCSDGWTEMESFAACRSLNLTAGEIGTPPESAKMLSTDTNPIWLDGVRCSPGSRLDACCRNEFGVHDCDHSKDVYLNCGSPLRATTVAPCPPGSTDCRPRPCNPQLEICLPQPPRTPDPPGVTEIPTTPSSGQRLTSARPPSTPSVLLSGRTSSKSDFNLQSLDINGLNFTNDGNFKHQFVMVEEIKSSGSSTDSKDQMWMELYNGNELAYARLRSRSLKLPTNTDGCLGYRILTGKGTQWSVTARNSVGRQEIAKGAAKARDKAEQIFSPIKSSIITREAFNIFIEAWVEEMTDLFAVDDITFYDGPCPSA